MDFKIGDLVTRRSYQNDLVFFITKIEEKKAYLKGTNIRLQADSDLDDLVIFNEVDIDNNDFEKRISNIKELNRNDYFYLPGKILHIDGDVDYLNKCLKYYEESNLWAVGKVLKEDMIKDNIIALLKEHNPHILVLTGHDAYYKNKGDINNINNYKNSIHFVNSVNEARKYEKSHQKLIIIAGACQSDYEELIKAGANFASSPKRVNIHALDPAIIATRLSLTESTNDIDLKGILEITKYGSNGLGGIITKGTMYVGYPR
ncbi:MAG: sporulation peptidase YabG [Mycoplasmatota bacterium]